MNIQMYVYILIICVIDTINNIVYDGILND
ncbi:hypothetical protein Fsol_00447 [Candidatus Fokinia solitaria]|uniref:Uncharacterized protein n=1 Tax=Candidatus Fokinia solitaria TaxID=1802984 RepID=A0A2U8BSC6_9RICK|nr:hypothetical protein Fsol_00447 [Candidatus Fokinia solitaria]